MFERGPLRPDDANILARLRFHVLKRASVKRCCMSGRGRFITAHLLIAVKMKDVVDWCQQRRQMNRAGFAGGASSWGLPHSVLYLDRSGTRP